MKQYRLKKDLPGVKAGEVKNEIGWRHEFYISPENFPDWFEPVRWRPELGEEFYSIDVDGDVVIYKRGNQQALYEKSIHEFGNYFKTREKAEAARDKVKELLKSL